MVDKVQVAQVCKVQKKRVKEYRQLEKDKKEGKKSSSPKAAPKKRFTFFRTSPENDNATPLLEREGRGSSGRVRLNRFGLTRNPDYISDSEDED